MRQIALARSDICDVWEIADNLATAFDRVGDFGAVQSDTRSEELVVAVNRLQESVGIDAHVRAVIDERLVEVCGAARAPGHVLFGLVLGLMAAQLNADG